ncbi:putative zinc-binding metallopeptidase [Thiomicrorhabdus sp. ZW0627]|uniref:zinc-binding metallopeptidase family protein n=1 Tax=Thiomicrorhabdus sp. ZW0627 TaxID=3039774 RepID=UPI002436C858|nr:putative zinc-binding metallopeptidase [Thiomicrorhabdus sp. ZW0627]MDG6774721.1 putative zinc-binding metallopeptidase [Thiomicrorhabdus sp. ZW0627]
MKRFFCHCGHEVFFHNLFCEECGRDLAYDPGIQTMWSGEIRRDHLFYPHPSVKTNAKIEGLRICQLRDSEVNCNWLISLEDSEDECQCISCRTTRIIPDLNQEKNPKRWRQLERAKRQLMYTLLELKIYSPFGGDMNRDLKFDFLEDKRSNPNVTLEHVLTGHTNGLITLNAAEADEGFLHTMKEQMGERYRTLLGHFRHEIGHYYWQKLIADRHLEGAFRDVFGDEREDYEQALQRYYDRGNKNHWMSRYITLYASSHPHEDWAETWAHYLHIVDTLETAVSYGLSVYEPKQNDFDNWFDEWSRVSQVMNALNRSMGMADPYPFVLSPVVKGKLRFIDELVDAADLTF